MGSSETKKSEEDGFVNNIKNRVSQISIDDLKAPFIDSLKKVYDKVKIDVSIGGGGGDLAIITPTEALEERRFQLLDSFQ